MLSTIRRSAVLLLLLTTLTIVRAQQLTVEAVVTDAETGQPLPFASIYGGTAGSTISNEEGGFRLTVEADTPLRFTYAGYKPLTVKASAVGRRVMLQPSLLVLREVVARGLPLKEIRKETLRQQRKFHKKRAEFFYRQTAFVDTTCHELTEAFLAGNSAVTLEDLRLLHGRYAGVKSDSLQFIANYYTFSQIELASSDEVPDYNHDLMPLFEKAPRFYNIDHDLLRDSLGAIYVVRFTPKDDVKIPILDCTLYVDSASLHILRCEGEGRNFRIQHVYPTDSGKVSEVLPIDFCFTVNMTEENGFVEVQSVYVNTRHVALGQTLTTKSILYNVGEKKGSKGKKLKFKDNLRKRINNQKYDPEFWRRNETVRRTPTEEAVFRMFETRKLFGVF